MKSSLAKKFIKEVRYLARLQAFKKPCIFCGYRYKNIREVRSFKKQGHLSVFKQENYYCCCPSCVLHGKNKTPL